MTGRIYAGEAIEPFVSDEQRALCPSVMKGYHDLVRPNAKTAEGPTARAT